MEKLTVVKVGGKVVEDESFLDKLLTDFKKIDGYKILVHGGGNSATKMAEQLGFESQMIDGRRVTDSNILKVATMVYGGLINKNIVAKLQAMEVDAIGLTGVDMNIILADKRPVDKVDYGFVGDIKAVATDKLYTLLKHDITPVLAPLTHDGKGSMLNTNADTIASNVALALAKSFQVEIIYCFEKAGVLRNEKDNNSIIPSINETEFNKLVEQKVIQGGMIPKLQNAFQAIKQGVQSIRITKADNLLKKTGTIIV